MSFRWVANFSSSLAIPVRVVSSSAFWAVRDSGMTILIGVTLFSLDSALANSRLFSLYGGICGNGGRRKEVPVCGCLIG
jgi:hypothetical protein